MAGITEKQIIRAKLKEYEDILKEGRIKYYTYKDCIILPDRGKVMQVTLKELKEAEGAKRNNAVMSAFSEVLKEKDFWKAYRYMTRFMSVFNKRKPHLLKEAERFTKEFCAPSPDKEKVKEKLRHEIFVNNYASFLYRFVTQYKSAAYTNERDKDYKELTAILNTQNFAKFVSDTVSVSLSQDILEDISDIYLRAPFNPYKIASNMLESAIDSGMLETRKNDWDRKGRGEGINYSIYDCCIYNSCPIALIQQRHTKRTTKNGFLYVKKNYYIIIDKNNKLEVKEFNHIKTFWKNLSLLETLKKFKEEV